MSKNCVICDKLHRHKYFSSFSKVKEHNVLSMRTFFNNENIQAGSYICVKEYNKWCKRRKEEKPKTHNSKLFLYDRIKLKSNYLFY